MSSVVLERLPEPKRRAALWLVGKELAARSLHAFVRQAWHVLEPDQAFRDNWHIRAICEHLEAVTDGRIDQLLINVPPGTMKSLLVCVFWFAWTWARRPGARFMFSSYSEDFAHRDSMKCRTLVESAWFQERWPTELLDDMNTKGKFGNTRGGWRMCGSIGGKGIGEHPDFNVFDDPHNVNQAQSDAELLQVKDWLDATFSTRGLLRNVRRVGIMQRLSARDASQVCLDKGGWAHLCFPMRYESPEEVREGGRPDGELLGTRPRMPVSPIGFQDPRTRDGELLWPGVYTEAVTARLENDLGLYHGAAQLQQRPTPRGGGKFKRAWFRPVSQVPGRVERLVRYWDKAGTKGGTGAESAGVLMAMFEDLAAAKPEFRHKFIILHVIAFREGAAEREALIKQTAEIDRGRWGQVETWVEQEPGSGGKESAEGTVGNLVGFAVQAERVTGSKEVRCDPLSSQASVGKVLVLIDDWTERFLQELEQFPLGKLKDMVDSAGGAFNKLNVGTGAFGSTEGVRAAKAAEWGGGERIAADRLRPGDF